MHLGAVAEDQAVQVSPRRQDEPRDRAGDRCELLLREGWTARAGRRRRFAKAAVANTIAVVLKAIRLIVVFPLLCRRLPSPPTSTDAFASERQRSGFD